MKQIVLQIPEGEFCEGCMFLQKELFASPMRLSCNLFAGKSLEYHVERGGKIDFNAIRKCACCPRTNNLVD